MYQCSYGKETVFHSYLQARLAMERQHEHEWIGVLSLIAMVHTWVACARTLLGQGLEARVWSYQTMFMCTCVLSLLAESCLNLISISVSHR